MVGDNNQQNSCYTTHCLFITSAAVTTLMLLTCLCVCVCGTGGGGGGCDLMACCCASNHITIILNIQHYTVRLIRNAQHVWTLSHLLVISSPALQLNLPTEPQEASKTAHSKSTTD